MLCMTLRKKTMKPTMKKRVPLKTEDDASKATNIILDMAKQYFGSGRTISMANYHDEADALIQLKTNGIYARFTYHQN
eukprot:2900097-Ditylum_brightwellii.AAC.1